MAVQRSQSLVDDAVSGATWFLTIATPTGVLALSEVQGIYLITDSSNGKQYVGKAADAQWILGRWMSYPRDGHGGNLALGDLVFYSIASDGKVENGPRSASLASHVMPDRSPP